MFGKKRNKTLTKATATATSKTMKSGSPKYYSYSASTSSSNNKNSKPTTSFPPEVIQPEKQTSSVRESTRFDAARTYHTMGHVRRFKEEITGDYSDAPPARPVYGVKAATKFFGVSLASIMARNDHVNLTVPLLIKEAIESLKAHDAQNQVGLFRVPGSQTKVDLYATRYNNNEKSGLEDEEDHTVICSLITKFLRELDEPILTFEFYPKFVLLGKSDNEDFIFRGLWALLRQIPRANFELAAYILEFVVFVSQYSETNKMTTANLAAVLRSTYLRPKVESVQAMFSEMPAALKVLDLLIRNFEYFFKDGEAEIHHDEDFGGEPVTNATVVPEGGLWTKSTYDFTPETTDNESLSFTAGCDILLLESDPESEWWHAQIGETVGYVPINYLVVPDS